MERFILGSRYYFSRLPEFEQRIYRTIYDSWAAGNSAAEIQLPGSEFVLPSGMRLHRLVTYIIDENPHLFHLETSQFYYRRRGERVTVEADQVYRPWEYRQIYEKLVERAGHIAAQARQYDTDLQRLRFLHDFLAENVTYDKGGPDGRAQREVHTIVGCLLNSACVCDGYARSFRLLCDQLHLSCIVAIGDSLVKDHEGPHAWNFVKLNNKVYHVDVTWDSNLIAGGCPVTDYYFLRGDDVFSKEHAWDQSLYPPIREDYPRREPLISSKWELERYLCGKAKAGERRFLVQFSEDFPGADALWRLLKDIMGRNPRVFAGIACRQSLYYAKLRYAEIHFE